MNDSNREDPIETSDPQVPRREPEVVPAISSEQPPFAAGIGEAAYADRENDQESHVPPTDNDGETVARDEVVDNVGS